MGRDGPDGLREIMGPRGRADLVADDLQLVLLAPEAGDGVHEVAPPGAEHDVFVYKVSMAIADSTPIVINELMAANDTTLQDPQGEYDDWIELLNLSDQEITSRLKAWRPVEREVPPGFMRRYVKLVSSAAKGAVLE